MMSDFERIMQESLGNRKLMFTIEVTVEGENIASFEGELEEAMDKLNSYASAEIGDVQPLA